MGAQWSQVFPPKPTFTETSLGSQEGKVFLITGGYSGIGLELAKILYSKHARVYIAGRSEQKAVQAIADIRAEHPLSNGSLEFLFLELDDLRGIRAAADAFKALETRLDVLWNNAGVSRPPLGSVSKQGIELQLATNCLGPFLFTQLLTPLLETTAAANSKTAPGSVRVVWTCSNIVELSAPPGMLIMSELDDPPQDQSRVYTNSKAGNWLLSAELARRSGPAGVVSVALNPGTAYTNLFRHTPAVWFWAYLLMCWPRTAAYTELYAGLSPDIGLRNNGCYVVPFGRLAREQDQREDLLRALRAEEEGGSGRAREFWEYCVAKTRDYYN
ncbi:short-chain dehydrogenase [Annulohypoxylon truncatum]|uniref:short-chain dehydrogenase n=1 Tax=Annulohypoxylon truncatum TaxID=327061 RepID=UPI0020081A59|nr:short-chain dehydrogenase [Annulohypoxylon truncatum]KAI1213964.1 short-chain dehydrogenase [Annulohypoxylon truncatum]